MRNIFVLLTLLLFGAAGAQEQQKIAGDSIPWELRKQAFIYNSAKVFNDPVVARMALYNLLAANPNNGALYDSLAILYFDYNQMASAALVAQQGLQVNPNNQFAMEIAAASLESLGAKDRALDNYEKLYLANQDINTLYKIAFLQMEVKRFAEANASLNIIIGDPGAETNTIGFPTENRMGQDVTLKAAAMRVQAMILEMKGDIEGAKAKYLEVLAVEPGFQIVQQQLRQLTKPKTGE